MVRKYLLSRAADIIGRGDTGLTVAQQSTRCDCKIVFDAAFVPSVKLVLTAGHKGNERLRGEVSGGKRWVSQPPDHDE